MTKKQNMVRLPLEIIQSVLKTEARMDNFLVKQAQKWEVENLA